MNTDKEPLGFSIADMLKNIAPQGNNTMAEPTVGSLPLNPSETMQDAGGGYNADFVDPQK
jgi:hypothetical protein